ncbi:MAG: hypothetical protein SFX74_01500 [Fimbriimonadaceae bacterium]|nr:hypothetical protein [Fimbriimonadaceae bacterium]
MKPFATALHNLTVDWPNWVRKIVIVSVTSLLMAYAVRIALELAISHEYRSLANFGTIYRMVALYAVLGLVAIFTHVRAVGIAITTVFVLGMTVFLIGNGVQAQRIGQVKELTLGWYWDYIPHLFIHTAALRLFFYALWQLDSQMKLIQEDD